MNARAIALVLSAAALVGFAHAAVTVEAPTAVPSRGWCVVYLEGEMLEPDAGMAAWCDAHPEVSR